MSKRQLSALLGLWVIIFLFLGFPIGWDRWIAVVTGLLIIFVAYRKVQKKPRSVDSAFVQNNAVQNEKDMHTTSAPQHMEHNSEKDTSTLA